MVVFGGSVKCIVASNRTLKNEGLWRYLKVKILIIHVSKRKIQCVFSAKMKDGKVTNGRYTSILIIGSAFFTVTCFARNKLFCYSPRDKREYIHSNIDNGIFNF